ncbi:phosphate/phosphite/phosphonate ABC transporter substrate-binding protein [Lutibacter sp.]|uniref:substrate-binding domain-containing protein n=1 Tax=Lutibacter sp. TaxID=1925666 RepID=UPI0025C24D08|nr:phosphate/phosphite/phosphonate ABC transporter substrate-binding protein [Lutibacter sp.]MCF6182675.1 phosphate/phosphite/phosphonate ABC transporter substrate-binding protein [Lutibacter sp.]
MNTSCNLNSLWFLKKLAIIFTFLLLFTSCYFNKKADNTVLNISITSKGDSIYEIQQKHNKPTLRVIVSSMISPKETRIYYQDLFTYMSKNLNYNIEFLQRKTYKEVNDLLIDNKVDLAIICSGAYINKSAKNKIEILVVPVVDGKPFYQSFIIVNKDSKINKFTELKNKKFAYTDPISNTGTLYAKWLVESLGENVDHYFSNTIYTYAHDISMQLVAKGIVDGASIDGLIFNYIKKHDPERVKNLKIIKKSELFGIPPVVVPCNLDAKLKNELQNLFLNIHKDSLGETILSKISIDKFIKGRDIDYNNIRAMNSQIK